jgi:splicing factor 3B subunit 2
MAESLLENSLNDLLKSKSEIKREEYLRRQKAKKQEKKKNKKINKKESNYDLELNENENENEKENENERERERENGNNKVKENSNRNINKNKFYLNSINSEYEERRIKENEELSKLLKEENYEIEYVDEEPKTKSKFFEDFKNVFEYFVIPKKGKKEESSDEEDNYDNNNNDDYYGENENQYNDNNNNDDLENNNEETKLSRKKRKQKNRMKISELKQKTNHPEVVEAWDVTAQDPVLLVYLKSIKNTIPVPKHWSQKRKFLQNKRGVLKPAFKLPDFIEATGIGKIRDNSIVDQKSLKNKMRERMQPKLGKLDIDYQILHDAFFKNQTKPVLTLHGDIYYENKEYENKMKIYKPGRISEKLRICLGIPENSPPPWIINMQRYGPPLAYPNLKIPGVNAPIADPTADITPNLWTPPVIEEKPIFIYDFKKKEGLEHWGDLREIDEEDFSDLDEDLSISDRDDVNENRNNLNINGDKGFENNNMFSGFDINDIDSSGTKQGGLNENLRKLPADGNNINVEYPTIPGVNLNGKVSVGEDENKFYSILEQKDRNIKKNEIMGSTHGYVIPANNNTNTNNKNDTKEEMRK